MSSRSFSGLRRRRSLAAGAAVILGVWVGQATAAQYYSTPKVSAGAEYDTNRFMVPAGGTSATGFVAELESTIGIATPRSETTVRPWLRLQTNTGSGSSNDVEGMLDFGSTYKSERSDFALYANYDYRDTSHSEFNNGQFNALDPNNPTAPETGRVVVGETRQLMQIRPQYNYAFTQRLAGGLGVMYQRVDYSGPTATGYVDYDYIRAEPALAWQFTRESRLNLGPYAWRYQAKTNGLRTDAFGGALGIGTKWSSRWKTDFSVNFERDKLNNTAPAAAASSSSTAMGAQLSGTYTSEVSTTQFMIGRQITPSGNGAVANSDQLQIAYTRNLNARTTAVLAGSYNNETEVFRKSNSWKYASANAEITWKVRPKWFVSAGYHYVFQHYYSQSHSADNNAVTLRLGYEGLGPRR